MAELVKWEPFREMTSLHDAMGRLFEESFLRPGWFGGWEPAASALPVDVYETDDHVVVKATVPGVKPEDIEVTITGDVLTIKGEFKTEEKTEKHNYLRQERRYGSFCRQLSVPAGADVDRVKATFEHGVLTLELPKVEAAKAKTVKVVAK
ncbi:MAG: Hsp20/alpha crystallin family protein [Chloroflexi bacterium]|nr:Hsp20/alpha crystallin family protein [Chloroflexota bacterium]